MTGIEGKQQMARMLDLLRQSPPQEIGGLAVTAFEDLAQRNLLAGAAQGCDRRRRPATVLIFRFGEKARVALRPSGTEPKAKAYIEVTARRRVSRARRRPNGSSPGRRWTI